MQLKGLSSVLQHWIPLLPEKIKLRRKKKHLPLTLIIKTLKVATLFKILPNCLAVHFNGL